jgi:protein O-GlcNAc transferase
VGIHRIKFIPADYPEEKHRMIYKIADILLDSYPFNGGTHTLEALWFNVPVVTKTGEQFFSRFGYSFLNTLGIEAGIAHNWEEYIDWGTKLGKNPDLTNKIKTQLAQSKQTEHLAPLWNPKKFAQDMYATLEQILP